eukprot:3610496-Prymnesium_polylepis.1
MQPLRHSAFIDSDSQLLTCGSEEGDEEEGDHLGTLGHGPDPMKILTPTRVPTPVSIRIVSSHGLRPRAHPLALGVTGAVFAFGGVGPWTFRSGTLYLAWGVQPVRRDGALAGNRVPAL